MKAYQWISALLLCAVLTACDAGAVEVTTTAPSESVTKTTPTTQSTTVSTTRGGCGGLSPAGVTGDERDQLLSDKTGLVASGMIDLNSLRVIGATPETAAGAANLFDGTEAQWHCLIPGDSAQSRGPVWVIFAATEKVKVTAYEIVTGSDVSQHYGTNLIEWTLYATNDPTALTAEDPETVEWVALDYVYDSLFKDEDLLSYAISVDDNRQGDYLYYAWVAGYTSNGEFRFSELELYIE